MFANLLTKFEATKFFFSQTSIIIKKSKDVHGETYDYSNIEYINGIIENIKCKIHGLFSQLKYIHIDKITRHTPKPSRL